MRRVVLHVDRLVLRGLDRADAVAVAIGLRSELRALLGDDIGVGTLAAHHKTNPVHAGKVHVPADGGATEIGRAVANRIVRGVAP